MTHLNFSVIVPVRNEAGNIRATLYDIPCLGEPPGSFTEILFVEGGSSDGTWEAIQRELETFPGPQRARAVRQRGHGKWDAVKTGIDESAGDVLIIHDGDLTVGGYELAKFGQAASEGSRFAMGSRLSSIPMERGAMPFRNLLANRVLAIAVGLVVRQRVTDSLCGNKMFFREDHDAFIGRIAPIVELDPYGDYICIFGARSLGLPVREIPVHYRRRRYGASNIMHVPGGIQLLKCCVQAFRLLARK